MLNKLNEKIRIFSHPLNFSHFHLIYFYTRRISIPEMEVCELIFEVLRYLILIVMWIQLIFSFTELVTYRNLQPMQICCWIFSKYFQNNFLPDNCSRPLSYRCFHIWRNSRLQKSCS